MSKGLYFTPPTGATFRKKEFFEKYGIDVKTGTVVEGVDYTKQELTLKGGAKLPYNKLLLATVITYIIILYFREELQEDLPYLELT
jgi:NADPH-dependent 2,4-dienoyl-CoA reductase/sulfur reductase-like enzyme